MALFKGFTFDNVNSLDYGIYITGSSVYNAPARDVELLDIPGRNGSVAIDKGRYQNIEITYPAGAFADDQETYAARMSTFRNKLTSRTSYKRLIDDYNTNEFRLAMFKDGLTVNPVNVGRAGEFDIIFNCKPQRFLVSGETPVEFTPGMVDPSALINPTEYPSKPLIVVYGIGVLGIGGTNITITGDAGQTIYIDCDTEEAYTKSGGIITPANGLISFNKLDFPEIEPGTTNISLGTGITKAVITPRWWRL